MTSNEPMQPCDLDEIKPEGVYISFHNITGLLKLLDKKNINSERENIIEIITKVKENCETMLSELKKNTELKHIDVPCMHCDKRGVFLVTDNYKKQECTCHICGKKQICRPFKNGNIQYTNAE